MLMVIVLAQLTLYVYVGEYLAQETMSLKKTRTEADLQAQLRLEIILEQI